MFQNISHRFVILIALIRFDKFRILPDLSTLRQKQTPLSPSKDP